MQTEICEICKKKIEEHTRESSPLCIVELARRAKKTLLGEKT